ncbi:MAG: NYN domain-containing protein [Sedimenticola sp.]|nr:NYN domain-containing protein [Sedimenticola sp.]
MKQEHVVMPSLGRMMVFVDGENLVQRFQAMVNEGRELRDDANIAYEKNIYVWAPHLTVNPGLNLVVRANYYTYAFGDNERIQQVKDDLKKLQSGQYRDPRIQWVGGAPLNSLYPVVFKKERGKKAKGVDIQLTVDILSNVYKDNVDSIYLVSGDGDYKPVLEEAIRHGKHVYVAALSSGLNPDLRNCADQFIDLDQYYFKPCE